MKQRPVMYLQCLPPRSQRPVLSVWKAPRLKRLWHFLLVADGLGPPGPSASGCTDRGPNSSSGCRGNTSRSDSAARFAKLQGISFVPACTRPGESQFPGSGWDHRGSEIPSLTPRKWQSQDWNPGGGGRSPAHTGM